MRNRISAADDDGMVKVAGRILQASADVVLLEVWVVGEDLFLRRSSREHFQNVFDPDSHVANARTTTTLTGFDRDSRLKECVCHVGDIQSRWAVQPHSIW